MSKVSPYTPLLFSLGKRLTQQGFPPFVSMFVRIQQLSQSKADPGYHRQPVPPLIPSLSALIVASKPIFCFFTFWISRFILRFKSALLLTFFSSSNLYLWQDNRQLFLRAGVIWKTDSCEPPLWTASYTSLCDVKDFSYILCSITSQLMENPFSVKLWPCENIKMILQMAHKLLYDSFSAKNGAKNTSRQSSLK